MANDSYIIHEFAGLRSWECGDLHNVKLRVYSRVTGNALLVSLGEHGTFVRIR